jgi:hypothetical protein
MPRTLLNGRFGRNNLSHLKKRERDTSDPRHVFYKAMLKHDTYEGYLKEVGDSTVEVPTFKAHPISGRGEILYARRSGWIVDE